MKLLDVFRIMNEAQFLIERDVINAKELKQWAKDSAARITDPQAATWYASQLFKFLINRYDGARIAQLGDFEGDPPEWVVAKFQAGQGSDILFIEPQQELRQQAEGVIDWLNAQTAENESLNLRMTWEEAVEAQTEWHRDIARQSRVTELTADQLEGIVTIMEFGDGYRWVDVQTEVCLQHEGTVMGHCVGQGGYTQGVSDSTTKILSLRDGNNNPHATVEGVSEHPIVIPKGFDVNSPQADLFLDNALEHSFVDMAINQIKGKENKPVIRKYRDYVQEFLTKFKIEKFGHSGLNDLENCGLFHLREGGYVNTEEIGEHIAKMDDGTVWHRVDTEYVDLATNYSSQALNARWFLFDKTGRSIGDMSESRQAYGGSIINRMSFNHVSIHGYQAADVKPYRDHIETAFNSKFDKGRDSIRPDSDLYRAVGSPLTSIELGVVNNKVGQPNAIGVHKGTTSAGEIYATEGGHNGSDLYWLMNGDKVQSLFTMEKKNTENFKEYPLHFDDKHGLPSGSMTKFLDEFAALFPGDININFIMVRDRAIMVTDIEWEPEEGNDEFIMEEDGIKFYQNRKGWYNAIDSHGHHIFNMHTGNQTEEDKFDIASKATSPSFKVRMVADPKIAGFYAVYLIDRQELDIGEFTDYSSFAREFLDETEWFNGRMSDTWYVMDEMFPIHFTETHSYDDGSEEDIYDDDTTMRHYWAETNLYDSGLEQDYFAAEYEEVYRGNNTGYDDEHDGYGDDFGGPEHVRTDYYIKGIGNADTVTHPVSGGTMRVLK